MSSSQKPDPAKSVPLPSVNADEEKKQKQTQRAWAAEQQKVLSKQIAAIKEAAAQASAVTDKNEP